MKRLAWILALTACLWPGGASADTILVSNMGPSSPGFHPETWEGGSLYMNRIKIGGHDTSPLGDHLDLAAAFTALSTWDGAVSVMPLDEPTKTGGWAWAWAWGHQSLNGRAIGRDQPPGNAPGGPTVVVAEPASLVLMGAGLIGLAGALRRRTRFSPRSACGHGVDRARGIVTAAADLLSSRPRSRSGARRGGRESAR